MDRLTAMRHFLAVEESKSFSSAAKRLGLANATVSQSVKNLEDHLGVRLITRTTRQLKLTPEGTTYAERCRDILGELDGLEVEIVQGYKAARGELRVELPAALGLAHILPHILDFSRGNPELQLTLCLNPGPSGLIEKGIDVAVQLGELKPSSLVAHKIYTAHYVACASPAFIESRDIPRHPRDLREADCLNFFSTGTLKPLRWTFTKGDELVDFAPSGALKVNNGETLIDLARRDAGIIYALNIVVNDEIKSGRLVKLFPDWKTSQRNIYIISHGGPHLPLKVRAFTEFLQGVFSRLGS